MNTNKKIEKAADVKKISLVSEKEYTSRYNKSGNPLLKNDIEERLYSNERVNGTSIIILAALASNKALLKKVRATVSEYSEGINNLLKNNFKSEEWRRLERLYKTGSNRSASPAAKINPVLRALRREGERGSIKGFAIDKIGSAELRAAFGFSIK